MGAKAVMTTGISSRSLLSRNEWPVLSSTRKPGRMVRCCVRRASDRESIQTSEHATASSEEADVEPTRVVAEVMEEEEPMQASSSGRTVAAPSWAPASSLTRLLGVAGLAAVAGGGFLGAGTFDSSGPLSVASAIGVLAAIITVHECGHFVAARSRNIHVTQFSIGFGPTIWSYKGPKVEYSLRSIPLGGFVGFPEDGEETGFKADDPDLLRNRSLGDRFLVMSAGIMANCVFAFSILFVQASTVGMGVTTLLPGVQVPKVVPGSVAEAAGMRKGDVIMSVGDRPISSSRENVNRLVQYIKDHPEKEIAFKVARKEGVVDLKVMAELDKDGDGKIGAQLATYAKLTRKAAEGPIDAAGKAGREFLRMVGLVGKGLLSIVTNFQQTKEEVSGPLAIVATGAEFARSDAANLFQFAAIVNVNLAIVNALPLPALDGGYILLLAVEAVRGKKLEKVVEQAFMASGFLLLTGLGIFLIARDALNLGSGLL